MHIASVFIRRRQSAPPLATDPHAQLHRRDAIARILRRSAVGRQDELVDLLRAEGFEATQSSVSRDLRELGVVKVADRYLLPAVEDALTTSLSRTCRRSCRATGLPARNLTVLRTATGAAQSVAVALDQARWPEIVGTIAGDDTIFVATAEQRTPAPPAPHLHSISDAESTPMPSFHGRHSPSSSPSPAGSTPRSACPGSPRPTAARWSRSPSTPAASTRPPRRCSRSARATLGAVAHHLVDARAARTSTQVLAS